MPDAGCCSPETIHVAIFNLTALPSHHEQDHGRPYKMTVVELLGSSLGRTRIEAKNLADIAAFVKTFGADVAKQVSVRPSHLDRLQSTQCGHQPTAPPHTRRASRLL